MLQLLKSDQRQDRDAGIADYRSPEQAFAAAISFIRRQYPVLLVTLLVTLGIATAYLLTTRSTYTAQASLIIDPRKAQAFQSQNTVLSEVPLDTPAVESQIELMRSENLARSVIRNLHLASDPEFSRYGGGLFGNALYYFYQIFESGEGSQGEAERRALRQFSNNLSVKRIGLTYVIEISYSSARPDRAAEVANAMAEAYITDQLDAKYQSAHRAGDWLSDRIQELKQQTTAADKSIADFKSENNLVDANGRSISEQQVAELNTQLVSARNGTAEARARLDRIQQIMKSDVRDATVADSLRNEVVSKLRSQYLDLANREADIAGRYGSGHLAAVNLRNQMHEIAASIKAELSRLAETYKSDYEIAKQREDEAQRALDAAVARSQVKGQAQVQLKQLESNSQIYRTLYESFLKRYTESVQQQSFPITEARVISVATRPDKRSSPKTVLVLMMACFGGLMLGLGIATLRDMADRAIRTSDQAEAMLGTDCLAILPALAANAAQEDKSSPEQPRTIRRNAGVFWTVANDPFSHYTEGVRAIKLAIDLHNPANNQARGGRVVGLSSALPSEGKSTVAASLALLCTQAGASSILVDGDLRNPSLTKLMAPNADKGLIEMIHGTAKLEEVVCKDDASGLHFLPAVTTAPLPYSCEILASDAMRVLIDNLSKQYDYVIVDLSPMAPIIDVRSTGHFIPTYVLIVEWGKTNIEVIGRALASAPNVREKLLGAVLNKADTSLLRRHEGYDGSYYHHPKYSQGIQAS